MNPLLHAGHQDSLLGNGVLPGDPVAVGLIALGLVLIVGGLYRLHTYEPSIEEQADS